MFDPSMLAGMAVYSVEVSNQSQKFNSELKLLLNSYAGKDFMNVRKI